MWGGELKCYIHTDRHTDRHTDIQTYRPSDEVGCRGAFAPKKRCYIILLVRAYKVEGVNEKCQQQLFKKV